VGVTEFQVEIASFDAGSVVVEAQIISLESEELAKEIAELVQQLADENTLLDENDFGVYSVADVAVVRSLQTNTPSFLPRCLTYTTRYIFMFLSTLCVCAHPAVQ
jgi:hypothetical protein